MANIDPVIEEMALRDHGILGRGGNELGNALYAIGYDQLPLEAKQTIQRIIDGGPFPHPKKDGTAFGDRFGDLISQGEYLEFTVPTPGVPGRGARRIAVRRSGIVFFTACHYERVPGKMSHQQRLDETAKLDAAWRNGFYVVTGMSLQQRQAIAAAVEKLHSRS